MAAAALEALKPGLSERFDVNELQKLTEAGYLLAKDFLDASEDDLILKVCLKLARQEANRQVR